MVFYHKPRWLPNFIWSFLMKYFEVNNDKNHLQIDDTYMNLYMTRKIKVTSQSGTIQFANGEIIGAIGNGSNTIDGYCSNSSTHCNYYISDINNAYIYIFATKPISSSTIGVQIFNDASDLIFDSNHKQAKVIGVGTNSGTVIGSNIAIAVGGHTVQSEHTIKIESNISSTPHFDTSHGWNVTYTYDYQIYRKVTTITNKLNVYLNGGVISTKTFDTKTEDSGRKLVDFGINVSELEALHVRVQYPPGISVGMNKSSGVISAFSYVVLDVNGL